MNPLRYVGAESSPWLLGVLALAVAILGVTGWARLRERRDVWGPGLHGTPSRASGYSPADLRGALPRTVVEDPRERWLLGLAAPFVEQAGLLHERWSLVPAFCDEAWRRRLATVATGWRVSRAREWRHEVAVLEARLADSVHPAQPVDLRPWLVANLAMTLRLGVAARHTSAARARKRLERAATPLRGPITDWLGYGDAIVAALDQGGAGRAAELRADLRILYAADGPWHESSWPER
ncbi:hypothetical protein [Nocardioides daejeonensis]|uniref:hypothetical protein n=1 Tax=Nocardioides daejeonensis TaxID=1046556 RepID=UPI000D7485EF|nr:hypothetical protein [Nocardioides daejeonensis]